MKTEEEIKQRLDLAKHKSQTEFNPAKKMLWQVESKILEWVLA